MFQVQDVEIALIQPAHETQAREATDPATVAEYAERMEAGDEFPHIVLFEDNAADLWVGEGDHRLSAARRVGRTRIRAEIRAGSKRDALLHSASSNRNHGRPRSAADKRRAVSLFLLDAEHGLKSDRAIAKMVGVSHPFVATVRAELTATGNVSSQPVRVGADGRAIDTARIGRTTPGVGDQDDALTDAEAADLRQLERVVGAGASEFRQVLDALVEVRGSLGDEAFQAWAGERFGESAEKVVGLVESFQPERVAA